MAWERAEEVQENDAGELRAKIGGQWVRVADAQENDAGQFRVMRLAQSAAPAMSKAATPTENPRSIKNMIGAAVEPNLALLSGALVSPLAGLAGIAGSLLPGKEGRGAEWVRGVEKGIYRPQTEGGINAMKAIGAPFELIAEGGHRAGGAVSDIAGPAAGAGVNAALQALPMLFGAKNLKLPEVPASGLIQKAMDIGKNVFGPIEGRAGRLLNTVAGPQRAVAVADAMAAHRDAVPGSIATVGEAAVPAGSAEMAALQKIIESRDPSKYGEFGISSAQEAARDAAVGKIARLPDWENPVLPPVEAAKAVRAANAKVNYGAVDADVVIPSDPKITAILERPSMLKAIDRAKTMAKETGADFPDIAGNGLTVRNAQTIKMALDDLVKNPERFGIGASEIAGIEGTKTVFINWLNNASPGWEKARVAYAADSAPVNRMETGQALRDALTNSLGTAERPTVFANAVKKAAEEQSFGTGKPRMADLTAADQQVIGALTEELARNQRFDKAAGEGAKEALHRIGASIPQIPSAGMFSPKFSVPRAIYNRVVGGAEEGVLRYLAKHADNPQKFAELMRNATPQQRTTIANALMRYQAGLGAQQGAVLANEQPQGILSQQYPAGVLGQ